MQSAPRILSVGTANPPNRYTQQEVISRYQVDSKIIQNIFKASHIKSRHLYLPEPNADGQPTETQSSLLRKHRKGAMEMGSQAIERALAPLGLTTADVDYLCVISSTGFMLPGLTAMFIKHLGFRIDCHRTDVVGMGCNAGLNGLNPTSAWAAANPGRIALMVCCEVNSALYVFDENINTGVVNSLFGDGCAAVVLRADPKDDTGLTPSILGFYSHIIPDTWDAMHYRWEDDHGKFAFQLARDVPYVLGTHAETPVKALLDRQGLKVRHVNHWIVHSGGKKVIDAIKYTVGITAHDVRHTVGILRDYGNLLKLSFSYKRLMEEGTVKRGLGRHDDHGPGSTIESALLRW